MEATDFPISVYNQPNNFCVESTTLLNSIFERKEPMFIWKLFFQTTFNIKEDAEIGRAY
jgi:hypothetical protein